MNWEFDRRSFLRIAAGSSLGAATSGITLEGISQFNHALAQEQVRVPDGPESWATAVCSQCPAGCGLRVRLIGKRAVKVQGNPVHPVSHGGVCPRGLASLQELYHPDRLRHPMKNTGSRQSPSWREISWDQALATTGERLQKLRAAGQAHQVILMDGKGRGLLARLLRSFLFAYGSPNYFAVPSGLEALQAAVYWQQGVQDPVAFDLENTRYLLSFGVNLLEGWGSPISTMRAFGGWRDTAAGRRAKFVQAESRFSITAARADEWAPLRPGTEAALALGIAYVLISEGLYDADFVRDHSFGFEDWRDADGKSHIGFKTLVTTEYPLHDVATTTGVPPETILRIAREAAHNRPALAIGDWQTSRLAGDPYAAMAVHSLNALLGSIGARGGVLLQQPVPALPEPKAPAHPALASGDGPVPGPRFAQLPRALSAQQPYAAQMVLVHEANPVFSEPNGDAFRRALADVPFVVSFASFMDETAGLADLVLPTPTAFESWQEASSPPTIASAVQSVSAPVVAPHQNTRPAADVFLGWARALGGPVAAALPFSTYEDYLHKQVEAIYAYQSGAVFSAPLEEAWNRLMERSGWWTPSYAKAEELWDQMKEHGGWWEPTYSYHEWDRVLRTPSGRFEFYSQTLAQWAKRNPQGSADDHTFLPHQAKAAESPRDYPLLLLPVEVLPFAGGAGAHLPLLQQIAGAHLQEHWESWLEINPETAERMDIADGDLVWVQSRRARVQARARLYKGVRPEVVHLPLGYGHTVGSPWACRGANPFDLCEETYEPLTGIAQASGTYVKVYRS
jgi:anaerobic selenocysteine-containing dehydrogenase